MHEIFRIVANRKPVITREDILIRISVIFRIIQDNSRTAIIFQDAWIPGFARKIYFLCVRY